MHGDTIRVVHEIIHPRAHRHGKGIRVRVVKAAVVRSGGQGTVENAEKKKRKLGMAKMGPSETSLN